MEVALDWTNLVQNTTLGVTANSLLEVSAAAKYAQADCCAAKGSFEMDIQNSKKSFAVEGTYSNQGATLGVSGEVDLSDGAVLAEHDVGLQYDGGDFVASLKTQ